MDDAAGPEVTVEDESEVPAGPWAEDGNQDCPAYHTAAFRMYVMKVGRASSECQNSSSFLAARAPVGWHRTSTFKLTSCGV